MKKTLIFILITLFLSSITVYADDVEKLIETNLSKKMTTFKIKGGGIDAVKAYVRMFAPKYRLKSWTSSYNPKTNTTTFKIVYNNGNLNIAKSDAVVKNPEELKKFLFDYTKGKTQHQVYLTTNNTTNETNDAMFIIKLDYPVSDWNTVRQTIADIDFTWNSNYRRLIPDVHAKYNFECLPVTVNYLWSAENKAYHDKYIGSAIKEIKETSRSQYEMIFKWFRYRENYEYDYAHMHYDGYINYLSTPVEKREEIYGDMYKDFVNTYDPSKDKPLIEDKNGICYDFSTLTWYVMEELGIKSIHIPDISIQHSWNIVQINGELWQLDYTNGYFASEKSFPIEQSVDKIKSLGNEKIKLIVLDEIKTYEQFKEHFGINE